MDVWPPVESIGVVAAASIAAWTALLAKSAAAESNRSASTLAKVERQRQRVELAPCLRVVCEPWGPGVTETLRMRVTMVGPVGLDGLDRLTATIRNDHFRRGDNHRTHMGGPTIEEIKAHVWAPYRFTPSTGPDDAQADAAGRTTIYEASIPIGEQLVYQLEHTMPGHWMRGMTQDEWTRQQGTLLRMAFTAEHNQHGSWYLPCEIETADLPATVYLPQWTKPS